MWKIDRKSEGVGEREKEKKRMNERGVEKKKKENGKEKFSVRLKSNNSLFLSYLLV